MHSHEKRKKIGTKKIRDSQPIYRSYARRFVFIIR
jgi:hypothetical protein